MLSVAESLAPIDPLRSPARTRTALLQWFAPDLLGEGDRVLLTHSDHAGYHADLLRRSPLGRMARVKAHLLLAHGR